MTYSPEEDCFTCAQSRKLTLCRACTEVWDGQLVPTAWYRRENCVGCPCRSQSYQAKDPEQPKELCLQKTFCEKRVETTQHITLERGVHLRLCCSIQVEGVFALLKNNYGFRRFFTWSRANIGSELFLLAMTFDLKKLWMKREHGRLQTRVPEKMTARSRKTESFPYLTSILALESVFLRPFFAFLLLFSTGWGFCLSLSI